MDDYKSSTGAMLSGSFSEIRSSRERGNIVCGIASYRMTRRYVKTLQKIKEHILINEQDSRTFNGNLSLSTLILFIY